MKLVKIFSLMVIAAMVLGACASPTAAPTEAPIAPAATEAPVAPVATEAPAAPVATEAPAAPVATEAPALPAATEAPAAEEKPLVLASVTDMRSLDPHVQEGMYPARSVMQWIFDVLVRSERDGSPTGELAKSWTSRRSAYLGIQASRRGQVSKWRTAKCGSCQILI